jgi:glycosyltransferase involved in cell wall biosynthesis
MPIIEANAVGRVVITSNISSMPEVADNASHYVDPFSIDDINKGFLKIINDENYRERLVEKGYENCTRFSAENIGRQYAALYYNIIGV